ncbi:MAG: class I SAM-dependent methyltransferase [Sedimentisphaerales bacterium]|nr:class I SAM-dependent methyltransferase [Sedimentisphaerales bacterium]
MPTENEIKNWYNKKHQEQKNDAWRPASAYRIFLDHLKVQPHKKLLDVGCGTGFLLKEADRRNLETFGVDISEEGVKIARQNSPNSTIAVSTAESLDLPDNHFDYITCIGVMEHFLDIKKGLAEMIRVAKKDATFCIVVPNSNWLIYKKQNQQGTDQFDINETLMTYEQWEAFFTDAGLTIQAVHPDKWGKKLIANFARRKPLLKNIYYRSLWYIMSIKHHYQFIFIMKNA